MIFDMTGETMRQRAYALLALVSGFHFCSLAQAAPSDDYRSGVGAFGNGQYEQALRHFTDARNGGMNTVTLHYNLGSTYYRLGRFNQALEQFALIADDAAWGALAHYNMGLIEEGLGREVAAREQYRIAYDRARTPKVKALAAAKLEAFPDASAANATDDSWSGLLSLSGGHDDNVLLSDSQSTLGTSNQNDGFAELQAYASRYVSGGFEHGWRLDLGGYYRSYFKQNDYNLGVANARIQYSRLFTSWYLESGGKIEAQTSGNQYLATVGTHSLQGMHAAGPLVLRVRNDFSYYNPGSGYDFIGGWQNRSGIDLTRRSPRARFRVGYELEVNRRKDNSQGSEFTSYSPLRHRLYVDVRRDFATHLQVDARVDYRSSRYADPNLVLTTGSVLTSAKRKDDRFSGSLRLTYRPGTRWKWFADYQQAENDSNFDQYAYGNGQISLGVESTF